MVELNAIFTIEEIFVIQQIVEKKTRNICSLENAIKIFHLIKMDEETKTLNNIAQVLGYKKNINYSLIEAIVELAKKM